MNTRECLEILGVIADLEDCKEDIRSIFECLESLNEYLQSSRFTADITDGENVANNIENCIKRLEKVAK